MEANTKQQQLTFDKGITNVPSDAICSDNALAESVGMVYENGEHRVIQNPADFITSAVDTNGEKISIRLLYVHKLNDEERYIAVNTDGYLVWGTIDGTVFKEMGSFGTLTYTENTQITSIGKTLIISREYGIKYAIWKNDTYNLYDKIPEPKIRFQSSSYYAFPGEYMSFEDCLTFDKDDGYLRLKDDSKDSYNNLIIGMYAEAKKRAAHRGLFVNPFMARYALELYDGSYTYISNPVMIFPCVTKNSYMVYNSLAYTNKVALVTNFSSLSCLNSTDYTEWSDIVKNIAIFVTDDIDVYDTTEDQYTPTRYELDLVGSLYECTGDSYLYDSVEGSYKKHKSTGFGFCYNVLRQKASNLIKEDIENISVFYRIGDMAVNGPSYFHSSNLRPNILENLTTQEQLPNDDYFSRCPISGSLINVYNGRLNVANIKRGFFDGFDHFMYYTDSDYHNYDFYVTIKTDVKEVIVHHSAYTNEYQGIYFYYPDSRAKHVVIMKGIECVCNEDLAEHHFLNGAYFFRGLPGITTEQTFGGSAPSYSDNEMEILPNYIVTSEINNPFIFKAEGYMVIGNGRVIGMSNMTQALSQGQFGQYPLILFTTEGVWAALINTTGLFTAVHPMSREVCNNPDSITQTDGAVFFTSEKGLMVVAGSDVRCMSEQMSGREDDFEGIVKVCNFADYLRNCFIAYDYRDSLLWIFNQKAPTDYCYIYSIKTGTFARYRRPYVLIDNVVNNYPDYLIQATDGKVYSLTERMNINDDETDYEAFIITRPMKLENSLALKSIRQIRHITDMQGTLKLRLFASNNLRHWAELHSLRGTPWKYFRFRYDFQNLRATDCFSGSIVVTQERRTDKLI